MIDKDVDTRMIVDVCAAHENYELPIHKEGEDQSEYSRLEYKGLWHSGVRLEPDTKQTKMDEPSPPAFTLKGKSV